MSIDSADTQYARYMLRWIESLEWPALDIAQRCLPQLRAFWEGSADVDRQAIEDELWAWVDANGGPQVSTDKAMILVRMLICLASAPNRDLQQTGYFEQLLGRYGLPATQQKADVAPVDPALAVAAPVANDPLESRKMQVLWAFAMLSFVSGAHPVTAMSVDAARLIELLLVSAMVFLIFLWYRTDAEQHQYPRSLGLNLAIVLLAAVAVPYYLIRSRGWQRGPASVVKAAMVFIASIMLSALGAMAFGHLA